jgi:L-lactate utilization protein LutB
MKDFNAIPDNSVIERTIKALIENGITTYFAPSAEKAKDMVFEIIKPESQIMTMTSVTLEQTGIASEINKSGNYNSSREKLNKLDMNKDLKEMLDLGATSDCTIGSCHAITEKGQIMIASMTGSQLSAYAYSSPLIIFVAGVQKIVKDLDEGMKRIYNHSFPLENERAMRAYGSGSSVNKILVINKEIMPNRINMILINESIGF